MYEKYKHITHLMNLRIRISPVKFLFFTKNNFRAKNLFQYILSKACLRKES